MSVDQWQRVWRYLGRGYGLRAIGRMMKLSLRTIQHYASKGRPPYNVQYDTDRLFPDEQPSPRRTNDVERRQKAASKYVGSTSVVPLAGRGRRVPDQGTCGGERAGPSPVDRRKGGLKRSVASDGYGIPLGIASAGGNRHDSPLLAPTLQAASRQLDHILPADRTCHLDRGYDSQPTRQMLDQLDFNGEIARKGVPAPVQAGTRWVVERTHSRMNGCGKLRRCTERNAKIVDFYLYLAAALVTIRQLIQRARARYRWDTRPITKRLK